MPKKFENNTDQFWKAITHILGIREQLDQIKNPPVSVMHQDELKALGVLLQKFEKEANDWVNI